MNYFIEAACLSNIGFVRKNNEDNFCFNGIYMSKDNVGLNEELYFRLASGTVYFAVFDGIGGSNDGQTASYLAAKEMEQSFKKAETDDYVLNEQFFEEVICKMNQKICEAANIKGNSMGTTAALLALFRNEVYVASLGDSKIFRIRDHNLTQISIDQIGETHFTINGVRSKKPSLRQFLGKDNPDVYIMQSVMKPGDRFLLCTDGLTDMVSESDILNEVENNNDVRSSVRNLTERAFENGGRDNITVILVNTCEKDFNDI